MPLQDVSKKSVLCGKKFTHEVSWYKWTIIGQVIGVTITRLTIDEVILDQITDKMVNRHLETEVKVEIELEITVMTIREVEVEIEMITGPFGQGKAHYLMEEMNLGPDLTLG